MAVHTDEYAVFLETWASHCGAPRSVFVGHVDALIQAELLMIGHDILARLNDIANRTDPMSRALARLFTDVDLYLTHHVCRDLGHADTTCPDRDPLIVRIRRAKELTTTPVSIDLRGATPP